MGVSSALISAANLVRWVVFTAAAGQCTRKRLKYSVHAHRNEGTQCDAHGHWCVFNGFWKTMEALTQSNKLYQALDTKAILK